MIKSMDEFKDDIMEAYQPMCDIDALTLDERAFGELKEKRKCDSIPDYVFLVSENAIVYLDGDYYLVNKEDFADFRTNTFEGRLFTLDKVIVEETIEGMLDKLEDFSKEEILLIHREVNKDLYNNYEQDFYIIATLK